MANARESSPPQIFDRAAYRARRARAPGGDVFLADDAAAHIAERLAWINRSFENALDLGSRKRSSYAEFAGHWTGPNPAIDEESLPYPAATFDLVISVLSLHAVNDLPGALVQIRRVLKPGGLLMAALFGGETLNELRTAFASAESELTGGASPRVAPFADVRDLGALVQRTGFARPVSDVERTIVRYGNLRTLFDDLRALGETNALVGRRTSMLSQKLLANVAAEYASRFADTDGKLRATFDVVYLTGYAS